MPERTENPREEAEKIIATALANCDMCEPHDVEEERVHARKVLRALEVNGFTLIRPMDYVDRGR